MKTEVRNSPSRPFSWARLASLRAMAECQIADAKLEEAILNKPDASAYPASLQAVRDSAQPAGRRLTLRSYGRQRVIASASSWANIRELLASGPPRADLGDNDEAKADKQIAALRAKGSARRAT